MSMEAMLDEERLEVLALLGDQSNKPRAPSSIGGRSPSPYTTTPRSPVRSMLEIGDDAPAPTSTNPSSPSAAAKKTPPRIAPIRSMLDVDSPPAQPVRSMLDVGGPAGAPVKQVLSNPSSPSEPNFRTRTSGHLRSLSDAASMPVSFGPRSSASKLDPTSEYQFSGIITNHAGVAMPKRVTLGGKKPTNPTSMMEVMRGNDVSTLSLPGEGRGRHYSVAGPSSSSTTKSKSPSSRLGMRPHSPNNNLISNRHLSPAGRAVLTGNQTFDLSNAYRRLSDARLAISGGSLSELPSRKRSDDLAGSGRLAKSYLSPDGDLLPDDSSDDDGASSSDEEGHRGRKAARTFDNGETGSTASQSPQNTRTAKSLLAAAEEERKCLYHRARKE